MGLEEKKNSILLSRLFKRRFELHFIVRVFEKNGV